MLGNVQPPTQSVILFPHITCISPISRRCWVGQDGAGDTSVLKDTLGPSVTLFTLLCTPPTLSLPADSAGVFKMVLETGKHPGALKDMVTSPGGTTIAGVHELEKAGVRAAMMNAVVAATNRADQLSKM